MATEITKCPETHLFAVGCVICITYWMSTRTYSEVTNAWLNGLIPADARDGYLHIWAISADRSAAFDHYRARPETELAREYARTLSAILPSGRGYA